MNVVFGVNTLGLLHVPYLTFRDIESNLGVQFRHLLNSGAKSVKVLMVIAQLCGLFLRLSVTLALGLMLLCGPQASAQDRLFENGRSIKGDRASASSNGFSVQQVATLDGEGFSERWNKPTVGVELAPASQMLRNQPIFTFVVFTGCAPDRTGNCNVTVSYKMFDPEGKPFGEQLNSPVWVGLPPPGRHIIQLSSVYLGMVVEDKDPLGTYRISASITDHVSGVTLNTEQSVTAVAQ